MLTQTSLMLDKRSLSGYSDQLTNDHGKATS
jgi:hypothetical protein